MSGVREVNGPPGLTLERQEKQVRKSLIQVFGAVVDAPFQIFYFGNLTRQRPKCSLHFFDVGGQGTVFELKQNGMTKHTGGFFRRIIGG